MIQFFKHGGTVFFPFDLLTNFIDWKVLIAEFQWCTWGEFSLTALRNGFLDSGLIVLEFIESNVLSINKQNIAVPIAFDNALSFGAKNM